LQLKVFHKNLSAETDSLNRSQAGKSGLSEDEIKKATLAALAAKPIVVGLERIKKKLTQSEDQRVATVRFFKSSKIGSNPKKNILFAKDSYF
jgi:hypothetical protein